MFASTKERDAAEVRRVLQGDPERFGVLVERYLPGVMALTAAHLRNMADAEDATQEAFLRAYRSLPNLREPRDFGAWLFTIARNASRGMIRGRIREDRAVDAIAAAAIPQPSPADAELRASVRERIDALDPDYREALLLHYYAGLTSAEMGRSLGISAGAARKRLQRAREALGEAMSRELAASLPGNDRLKERGAKIMGAVGALGVVWEAQAAVPVAAALTVASLLPSSKLAIGAVVGIAATLGFGWFVAQQAEDSPTDAVEIQLAAQQPAETLQPAAQPPNEPAPQTVAEPESEPTPEAEVEPWPDTGVTNAQIEEILKQPVGLVFEDIHMVDFLDFVQDTYAIEVNTEAEVNGNTAFVSKKIRLPFYIDSQSVYVPQIEDYDVIKAHRDARQEDPAAGYATDGMFDSIDLRDKPVGEMLAGMTEALGLSYVSEPGYFWISTPQRIAREVVRLPDERYARYDNEVVAGQTASLVFNDQHLREIVDFITDTYDVNIIIDTRVVAPSPQRPPTIHGYTPEGYATSGRIPYINLQDVELRDVFRGLFRTLNLAYRIEHGAIMIASPVRLNSGNLTRESMLTPREMHERRSGFQKAYLEKSQAQETAQDDVQTQEELLRESALTVRHIRTGENGKPTAQIQTPLGGFRWYEEGHAFEQFRVDKIDVERNQVHLTDETTGEKIVLLSTE